jgi:signal transduction histidine kinase
MADKLQSYEAERQNMIADIAHELRTPLSVIQGNLEAMLDNVLPTSDKELALLHQETILLNRLISDLRTLSLAEAGQLNLRKRSVNLTELVEQVIERLQLRIEEKGIDLRTTIPVGLPRVQADPERLSQILSNLVDNALRYTPAGTLLEVSAKNIEEGTQVSVIDNGPGIPEDELPKLFDRFWRAEKSRNRATGGSGLGLAIVKQLVMAHGGRVWAENLPGKGVQFNIILPG